MSLSGRRWNAATAASSCLATALTVAGLTGRPRIGNRAIATLKPLTTAGMAAAQAAARRAVNAIERQARERTEAGLELDPLPDLSAEGERDGFYQAQLIRELAVRHVTNRSGIELGGGPAPPTPENIAAVMELYPVGERFFQEFTLRQVLLNAAKNGCMDASRSAREFFDRPT
jgi:hypothetical protein